MTPCAVVSWAAALITAAENRAAISASSFPAISSAAKRLAPERLRLNPNLPSFLNFVRSSSFEHPLIKVRRFPDLSSPVRPSSISAGVGSDLKLLINSPVQFPPMRLWHRRHDDMLF